VTFALITLVGLYWLEAAYLRVKDNKSRSRNQKRG
jgi:hypothetical protein